jgi:hypothetical protein
MSNIAFKIFIRKTKDKKVLGRYRFRREDKIKMDRRGIRYKGVGSIIQFRDEISMPGL